MNARTKNILHVSVITITVAIVMVIARQGFAWTNPAGAPPFASAIISTLGNNVGVGTTNPNSKLEVFAPTLGSNVGDTVEVQRLNSSNGNNNYLDARNMRTAAGTDWNTAGTRIQEKVDSTWMGYLQFNGDSNNGGISFGTGLTTTAPGNVGERMRITSAGNMSIGTASPDANYKITTANGGIKADANTGQAAGYFNNIGGGPAIIAGTGGITLGGVNQTSWPSSGLGGSGTANYLPKWTSGSALGNSSIQETVSGVSVNNTLGVGSGGQVGTDTSLRVTGYTNDSTKWALNVTNNSSVSLLTVRNDGNVGIGTTNPQFGLDVRKEGTGGVLRVYAGSGTIGTAAGIQNTNTTGTGLSVSGGAVGISSSASGSSSYGINTSSSGSGGYGILAFATGANSIGGYFQGTSYALLTGTGNVGIGTTNPTDKLEINGNLRFTGANPYINAASYFIAPGGAYFNSGTVYTEAAIQARGGLHNDAGSYLTLQGGTTGKTMLSGALRFSDGTEQATAGGSTSVFASASVAAADWFTGVLSPDCVQYNNGGIYYVCTKIAYATIPAGRNKSCFLTSTEFDDRYAPTLGVNGTLQRPSCQAFSNGQVNASLTFMGSVPDRYDNVYCVMTCIIF